MRALQLATVRAFLKRLDRQSVVRAAHATAGGRSLSLGDGHRGTLICLVVHKSGEPVHGAARTMQAPAAADSRASARIAKPRAYSEIPAGCKQSPSHILHATNASRLPRCPPQAESARSLTNILCARSCAKVLGLP